MRPFCQEDSRFFLSRAKFFACKQLVTNDARVARPLSTTLSRFPQRKCLHEQRPSLYSEMPWGRSSDS